MSETHSADNWFLGDAEALCGEEAGSAVLTKPDPCVSWVFECMKGAVSLFT